MLCSSHGMVCCSCRQAILRVKMSHTIRVFLEAIIEPFVLYSDGQCGGLEQPLWSEKETNASMVIYAPTTSQLFPGGFQIIGHRKNPRGSGCVLSSWKDTVRGPLQPSLNFEILLSPASDMQSCLANRLHKICGIILDGWTPLIAHMICKV